MPVLKRSGTILDKIVASKGDEVARLMADRSPGVPPSVQMPPTRDFLQAVGQPGISIIAEIKRKSPSAGLIRSGVDPAAIAEIYEKNGAAAISVLTDQVFFGGSAEDLRSVRRHVAVPLLRKDFIIAPCQVVEARMMGADAILLITAILRPVLLKELQSLAKSLDMVSLVEVHTEAELETALDTGAELIGINSRNLKTFEVDLNTALTLRKQIPGHIPAVAESGIRGRADIERLEKAGFDAALVSETLMRSENIGRALRQMKGIT